MSYPFCSVLAHNSIQGYPVHSHCHVLQYAKPHTNPHVWTLVSTNANTGLAYVSSTQQPSLYYKHVSLSVGTCHLGHSRMYWCVCAVLPPLFHHIYSVCTQFDLCVLCSVFMLSYRPHVIHELHSVCPRSYNMYTSNFDTNKFRMAVDCGIN